MFNLSNVVNLRIATTLLLFSFSTLVFAEEPISPAHFAFSASLSDSENSLRELLIPKHVMENSQRADFGDVRLFNAEGRILPHELVAQKAIDTSSKKQLVFYPFNQQQAADAATIRIKIMQNKAKQSIDIQSSQGQGENFKSTLGTSNEYQYIIENPQRSQKLCALKLSWQQKDSSLIIPFRLEASDDLQSWSALNHTSTISKLDYSGSQLIRPDIEFPCTSRKFLRLTWLKPEQNIRLKTLSATYQQAGSIPLQQVNLGKPQQGKNNRWFFETNGFMSLSNIKFLSDYDGLLYKGRLYSRADKQSKWQFQTAFTQYRLKMNDAVLESSVIALPPMRSNNKHQYWKIELDSGTGFSQSQLPDIAVSWQQQKLVFLAQGNAPYTIAYGNKTIQATQSKGIDSLIRTLQRSGGSPDKVSMNVPVKNTHVITKAEETPWKLIGFWLLLVLGTAVLSYMAYSLYKQMNDKK